MMLRVGSSSSGQLLRSKRLGELGILHSWIFNREWGGCGGEIHTKTNGYAMRGERKKVWI